MMLSALALVSFWACKREQAPVNPTYNPEANTVTTQFVLNISPASGPNTKQTAVDVQASGANFRGIERAHLLTYNLAYAGPAGSHYMWDVDDASSMAVRDYDLGTLATTSDISEDDTRRILELALPLGTNTIMLYGIAPKTGSSNTQGSISMSGTALNTTLENVSFKLNPRMADEEAFTQCADLFGRILTGIMNAGRRQETTSNGHKEAKDNTYTFWWPIDATSATFAPTDAADAHAGYEKFSGSKTWNQYGKTYATDPTSMKPLEEVLGEAYDAIMHLETDDSGTVTKTELRAGAAVSIVRLVADMFNIIQRVLNASPTTPEEYIAQLVAENIRERASWFFSYDSSSSKINFKTRANILDAVDHLIPDRSSSNYNRVTDDFIYYSKISNSDERVEYKGFPLNMDMPMGAAIMDFVTVNAGTDNEFVAVTYPQSLPAYGMGATSFPIANYRYPAELIYYSNSCIRTSDTAVEKSVYPAVTANWANDSYWSNTIWSGDEVKSTTRSVAVSKPLNYGTALLKAQFAYKEGEIEDNNKGIHPAEANNKVNVSTASDKFLVSGIIIGGVHDEVGWDFIPKGTLAFNKMIYDNLNDEPVSIPKYTTNVDAKYSLPVYTCTWDNYNRDLAANAQQKVYIAIELINNTGEDLWGELNLIRNGGTFYLIGELDPTKEGVADNLKKAGAIDLTRSDMFYPPFDDTGATINAPRVFMQDYVTSVKFNFAKDALKNAYLTMPDLRSGQVSLGLSVDLTWEKGLEFNVDMGHTN